MKLLKQEEFKSGQVVLFEYEGETHEGIVEVEGKRIFICQDAHYGIDCKNKHGKKYSYVLCREDGSDFRGKGYVGLKNIRLKPKSVKKGKPVNKPSMPKYVFENRFKLNGQDFDIMAHREKIARLKAELKEAQGIDKAFVKFNGGK